MPPSMLQVAYLQLQANTAEHTSHGNAMAFVPLRYDVVLGGMRDVTVPPIHR